MLHPIRTRVLIMASHMADMAMIILLTATMGLVRTFMADLAAATAGEVMAGVKTCWGNNYATDPNGGKSKISSLR